MSVKMTIRIDESTKELFSNVCKAENKTANEMIKSLLEIYCTYCKEGAKNNEELNKQINKIYEYISLLVKASPNLPHERVEMKKNC